MPVLLDEWSEALGVTRAQLREMGTEGELTAEMFMSVFGNNMEDVQETVSEMGRTSDQAMTQLSNAFSRFIGEATQGAEITQNLNSLIDQFIGFLEDPQTIETFGEVISTMARSMEILVQGVEAVLPLLRSLLTLINNTLDTLERLGDIDYLIPSREPGSDPLGGEERGDYTPEGNIGLPGMHDGGVVGRDFSFIRDVNPDVFIGAQRYQRGGIAGLAPGEVPTILHEGEVVFPTGGVGDKANLREMLKEAFVDAFEDTKGTRKLAIKDGVEEGMQEINIVGNLTNAFEEIGGKLVQALPNAIVAGVQSGNMGGQLRGLAQRHGLRAAGDIVGQGIDIAMGSDFLGNPGTFKFMPPLANSAVGLMDIAGGGLSGFGTGGLVANLTGGNQLGGQIAGGVAGAVGTAIGGPLVGLGASVLAGGLGGMFGNEPGNPNATIVVRGGRIVDTHEENQGRISQLMGEGRQFIGRQRDIAELIPGLSIGDLGQAQLVTNADGISAQVWPKGAEAYRRARRAGGTGPANVVDRHNFGSPQEMMQWALFRTLQFANLDEVDPGFRRLISNAGSLAEVSSGLQVMQELPLRLQAGYNEATGRGFLNEAGQLITGRNQTLEQIRRYFPGTEQGSELMGQARTIFRENAQELVNRYELTGEQFDLLIEKFPEFEGRVESFSEAAENASDSTNRFAERIEAAQQEIRMGVSARTGGNTARLALRQAGFGGLAGRAEEMGDIGNIEQLETWLEAIVHRLSNQMNASNIQEVSNAIQTFFGVFDRRRQELEAFNNFQERQSLQMAEFTGGTGAAQRLRLQQMGLGQLTPWLYRIRNASSVDSVESLTESVIERLMRNATPENMERFGEASSIMMTASRGRKSELERQMERLTNALENLGNSVEDLMLGPLSPLSSREMMERSQQEFYSTLAAAGRGELGAIERLPSVGRSALSATKDFYPVGTEPYSDFFNEVTGGMSNIRNQFGGSRNPTTVITENSQRQTRTLETMNDNIVTSNDTNNAIVGVLNRISDENLGAIQEALSGIISVNFAGFRRLDEDLGSMRQQARRGASSAARARSSPSNTNRSGGSASHAGRVPYTEDQRRDFPDHVAAGLPIPG
jgi:hypothetical protein